MRWVVIAAAALLVAASGCSDDGGDDGAVATTSTTSEVTTSTSSTAITSPPETTTTAPAPTCLLGGDLPQPIDAPASIDAEIDGLAGGDFAATFLASDGWHLRVELGDGSAADELLATTATDLARVLSATDLDDDGTAELFVQVGTGAAVMIVGLYDLDGCDLEPILLGGNPAEFPVGGTVLNLQGLACGASDLTLLTATSVDGASYDTVDTTHELRGGALVAVGEESGTRLVDDPVMAAYSEFAC